MCVCVCVFLCVCVCVPVCVMNTIAIYIYTYLISVISITDSMPVSFSLSIYIYVIHCKESYDSQSNTVVSVKSTGMCSSLKCQFKKSESSYKLEICHTSIFQSLIFRF